MDEQAVYELLKGLLDKYEELCVVPDEEDRDLQDRARDMLNELAITCDDFDVEELDFND